MGFGPDGGAVRRPSEVECSQCGNATTRERMADEFSGRPKKTPDNVRSHETGSKSIVLHTLRHEA